jgi:hypothetical protein
MSGQSCIYISLLNKLDKIKQNIIKIKDYTENMNETKNKEYLEILLKFSSELDSVESISDDMFDQYILQLDETKVKNQDLSLRKKILINKHIEDTFMPYILYMQIMLLNS